MTAPDGVPSVLGAAFDEIELVAAELEQMQATLLRYADRIATLGCHHDIADDLRAIADGKEPAPW